MATRILVMKHTRIYMFTHSLTHTYMHICSVNIFIGRPIPFCKHSILQKVNIQIYEIKGEVRNKNKYVDRLS